MAKIKHTKNELKAQKEALHRYERFLPMLQLKKQQLQVEIHSITVAIEEKEQEAEAINAGLQTWV
ncbi:MAG: V-type ATP synthase subunit D, partial [Verrucomicrobiota bacterium]|nr:V-type ATP synthase subunit D [Verrucomicrobiota bacterium]